MLLEVNFPVDVSNVYVRLQAHLHQLYVDRSDGTKTVEEFLGGAK